MTTQRLRISEQLHVRLNHTGWPGSREVPVHATIIRSTTAVTTMLAVLVLAPLSVASTATAHPDPGPGGVSATSASAGPAALCPLDDDAIHALLASVRSVADNPQSVSAVSKMLHAERC
jgi:hypothetical protein